MCNYTLHITRRQPACSSFNAPQNKKSNTTTRNGSSDSSPRAGFRNTLGTKPCTNFPGYILLKVTKWPLKINPEISVLSHRMDFKNHIPHGKLNVTLRTLKLIKLSPVVSIKAKKSPIQERCPSHGLPEKLVYTRVRSAEMNPYTSAYPYLCTET